MSETLDVWKQAVCETREAYEAWGNIAMEQDPEALTAHISALETLCSIYESNLRTARNDVLEEAEHSLDAACNATGGHFVVARAKIRALKESPHGE